MLNELKETANMTITKNGDNAYHSTQNAVLDLFSKAGSLRQVDEETLLNLFKKAYIENPELTLKCLFYIRDIHQGVGEREAFRTMMRCLLKWQKYKNFEKILTLIPEYGRWDDLLCGIFTSAEPEIAKIIKNRMKKDMKALREGNHKDISLMAKWMPKRDTSSSKTRIQAARLRRLLKMEDKKYRKNLVELRKALWIVESDLSRKDYTFDYEKVPSLAMMKYKKAFERNDQERYESYIRKVKEGRRSINTAVLEPYQIAAAAKKEDVTQYELDYLDTAWNNLPDYAGSGNSLAVVDGSGSMTVSVSGKTTALDVAISLGLYFAERNKGHFHNHFITFSSKPQLIEVQGRNIKEKLDYISTFDDTSNTNIEKVYKLLLDTALKHNLPQSDMPETLYIISDMQFDKGTRSSDTGVFESMKKLYKENGYKLPGIIFWNVNARYQTFPVTKHETGAITVSGFSKNIFKIVQNNDFEFSPEAFMLNVLNSERYKDISLANVTTKPQKEKASKEKSKKACGDSKSQKAASNNSKKDFKKKPQNFKKKTSKK